MAKTAQEKPEIKINLLTQDEFSSSAVGRIMLWALSVGRYIVVFTELIVILSFLSRFKLDRDLADLNESIEKQKAIILSLQDMESKFRLAQDQLTFIEEQSPSVNAQQALATIKSGIPPDVRLDSMSVTAQGFNLEATALSMQGFAQFIRTILANENIADVSLSDVEAQAQGLVIEFNLAATFN